MLLESQLFSREKDLMKFDSRDGVASPQPASPHEWLSVWYTRSAVPQLIKQLGLTTTGTLLESAVARRTARTNGFRFKIRN